MLTLYVEPCLGGAQFLLSRDWSGVAVAVCDLHAELTNFWKVLQSETLFSHFIRLCEATPFSEVEFNDAANVDQRTLKVNRAHAFFIRCRMSRAGATLRFTPMTKTRTRRGMQAECSAWLTAIEGLPDVHRFLQQVFIYAPTDVCEIVRKCDAPGTLFYIDPPYIHASTRATTNVYMHEMSIEQHAELLETLADIEGRFILSGYPSVLYEAWRETHKYHWEVIDIDNKASAAKTKGREIECLWMNFTPGGNYERITS